MRLSSHRRTDRKHRHVGLPLQRRLRRVLLARRLHRLRPAASPRRGLLRRQRVGRGGGEELDESLERLNHCLNGGGIRAGRPAGRGLSTDGRGGVRRRVGWARCGLNGPRTRAAVAPARWHIRCRLRGWRRRWRWRGRGRWGWGRRSWGRCGLWGRCRVRSRRKRRWQRLVPLLAPCRRGRRSGGRGGGRLRRGVQDDRPGCRRPRGRERAGKRSPLFARGFSEGRRPSIGPGRN